MTFDADLPHHFENPGDAEAQLLRRGGRRPEEELRSMAGTRRCSTRSGRPTRSRRACSTWTSTSCTRSPRRRHSSRCGWPGARAAPPGPHAGHRRPQRAHRRLDRGGADRRPAVAHSGRDARGATAREFGVPIHSIGSAAPGHRARDRPRAGRDPAGHDDRLRRLAHLHPRRLRRAGVRHRHQRGRARARHPDAAAAQAALDAHQLRGRARLRGHRQGPDPRHDRPHRRRRRRGPRDRVRRPAGRGALDGGPDDRLQHDHRGRRPRRA